MTFDHVLRLHALGLSVIPLQARKKEPDLDSWARYQKERPTEADLLKWFGNGAQHNVGIVLGKVSKVVVVESDTPEAEAWCAQHLPPTPMMTRSARGFHRYYLRPTALPEVPALINAPNGLKIEIKRDGQYVVGPGSVHPGKPELGIRRGTFTPRSNRGRQALTTCRRSRWISWRGLEHHRRVSPSHCREVSMAATGTIRCSARAAGFVVSAWSGRRF